MWKVIRNYRGRSILAILSGLLLWLSFPKIDQAYLAWLALVPLLLSLRGVNGRAGFMLGLAAGMVQNVGLFYWTVYAMNMFGDVPLLTAIAVLLLLAAILSTFSALFGLGVTTLCRRPWQLVVGAPALWVLLEWVRSWLFTGFPWELLGYSQYKYLWVIQIADLFGVPGISALIVLVNAVLALAVLHWVQKPWQSQVVTRIQVARPAWLAAVLVAACLVYGVYRVHTIGQEVAQAPGVRVALVQGNVGQDHKWDAAFQMLTTAKYRDLSLKAAGKGADLVVWPETATPFYMFHDQVLTEMVVEGIKAAKTDFVIGTPSAETIGNGRGYLYYNSAYLFSSRGELIDKYDKVHLVPFGEYVPMKRWLPFLGKMVEQVGDFSAGHRGNVLKWDLAPIGMLICYEVIFPDLARAMVGNGARLLINITNDAWFGRTSAAYQHFSMAVLRCVENRRAMARSANTGISGFIDPCGRILAQTPLYEDRAPVGKVALMDHKTFYTAWGDWPLAMICLALVLIFAAGHYKARKQTAS